MQLSLFFYLKTIYDSADERCSFPRTIIEQKMTLWSGNICYIKRACTIYSILGSQDWIVRLNAYTVRGILARIMQGTNARKVILEVYAFFVLQCTVFGRKSKHKMDVTA